MEMRDVFLAAGSRSSRVPTLRPDNLTKTHMQNIPVLQDQTHETKKDIATISHDAQKAVFLIVVSQMAERLDRAAA